MADRDLTRFLPAIVLGGIVGLIIILQIPIPDSHAEDTSIETAVSKNLEGLLRFGSNIHSGQTIPVDTHDEAIPVDTHDESIPVDTHDEITPDLRMVLDRMNDLEKNQENLQRDLRDLIDKLKDKQ